MTMVMSSSESDPQDEEYEDTSCKGEEEENSGASEDLPDIVRKLFKAVKEQNEEEVRMITQDGADVCSVDINDDHTTPLLVAAGLPSLSIIKILVTANPSCIDDMSQFGENALHFAIRSGNHKSLDYLIESGADIDAYAFSGHPLTLAIKLGQVEAINKLLDHGAYVHVPGLLHAVIENGNQEILDKMLAIDGLDLNEECDIATPLQLAATYGDTESVKKLLNAGADIERTNIHGERAIHKAVQKSHSDVLELLISCGCNVNVKDRTMSKLTPILIASQLANHRCVELLLRNGADASITDREGLTPLNRAMWFRNEPTALLLIRENCNLDLTSSSLSSMPLIASSPLRLALIFKFPRVVAALLASGLDKLPPTFSMPGVQQSLRDSEQVGSFFIASLSERPSTLVNLCRIKIRKSLQSPIYKKLALLHLPTILQEMLYLEDVVPLAEPLERPKSSSTASEIYYLPASWQRGLD